MGLITSFLVPLITKTELVLLDPLEWVVNPRSLFEAIRTYGGTLCWQPNLRSTIYVGFWGVAWI